MNYPFNSIPPWRINIWFHFIECLLTNYLLCSCYHPLSQSNQAQLNYNIWKGLQILKPIRAASWVTERNVNESYLAKGNLHANWLSVWYDKKKYNVTCTTWMAFNKKQTPEAVILQVELIKLQPLHGWAKWLATRSSDPSETHKTVWHSYIVTWKGTPSLHVERLMWRMSQGIRSCTERPGVREATAMSAVCFPAHRAPTAA